MCVITLLFIIGLSIISANREVNREKVKVSIYYEALCPDSIQFVEKQLNETYSQIGDYLDVDLIPYGKASQKKENGTWHFKCQHGPRECEGNKMQACAIHQAKPQKDIVEFVACVMNFDYERNETDTRYEECANELGFSWMDMKNCFDNGLGDELLVKYGERTHNADPIIVFIPTIFFNNKYDPFLQTEALRNFIGAVCSIMKNKPKECPEVKINDYWWI